MSRGPDRNALVDRYRPLALRLSRRYRPTSESPEDLAQVAYLGLVLAAERYSPEHGSSFTSFAIPTILGELRRHMRDHSWAARVPRSLQENVLRVTSAADDLRGSLRRAPTPGDVARATGLELGAVLEAMEAATSYAADSLDRQRTNDDEARGEPLVATIGDVDRRYELVEEAVSIRPAVAELSPQEREVLAMRFFEDLTQSEIAARLGVSQMHISRLIRRALDQLQTATQAAA